MLYAGHPRCFTQVGSCRELHGGTLDVLVHTDLWGQHPTCTYAVRMPGGARGCRQQSSPSRQGGLLRWLHGTSMGGALMRCFPQLWGGVARQRASCPWGATTCRCALLLPLTARHWPFCSLRARGEALLVRWHRPGFGTPTGALAQGLGRGLSLLSVQSLASTCAHSLPLQLPLSLEPPALQVHQFDSTGSFLRLLMLPRLLQPAHCHSSLAPQPGPLLRACQRSTSAPSFGSLALPCGGRRRLLRAGSSLCGPAYRHSSFAGSRRSCACPVKGTASSHGG